MMQAAAICRMRADTRTIITVVFTSLLILVHGGARAAESASANDIARFLAGMQPSAGSRLTPLTRDQGWQRHAGSFDLGFSKVERQLTSIRGWSKTNLEPSQRTLFYMFSGPDFLYANAFFPEAPTYVLSGLEPVGEIPNPLEVPRESVPHMLGGLQSSMRSALNYSFFRTKNMRKQLRAGRAGGTLPVLYVFLARSGKVIHDVRLVHLDDAGTLRDGSRPAGASGAQGARIEFSGSDGRAQTLYYFSTNLADDGFHVSGFAQFCEKLGDGDSFLKSASYLLHGSGFSQVRNFLLAHSFSILQDDSGAPVAQFDQNEWHLRPYGRYTRPIRLFARKYQPKLRELFQQHRPSPLDFSVGYRWRRNASNLVLAVRREATPAPSAVVQSRRNLSTASP
jgi:hypothetical protein